MRNARLIALASLFAASPLAAKPEFDVEFVPARPTIHDVVVARIVSVIGGTCFPDPAFSPVLHTQRAVELTFTFTDACDPNFVGPSWDYPLGTLDEGTWEFVLQVCFSNPPPLESYCINSIKTTFAVRASDDGVFRGGFD